MIHHVVVFASKVDQEAGEASLNTLGVAFESLDENCTLIRGMDDTDTFFKWVAPYNRNTDDERPKALLKMRMFDSEVLARAAVKDFFQEIDADQVPGP